MDGSSFDRWTRELATSGSRRWLGKRLVAVAGAAIAGGARFNEGGAARRPAPTPTTPRCPGVQYWEDSACVCPPGSTTCGPDCCPEGQATCCDNACCFGACYGEETCCPTGNIVCAGVCVDWECCDDTDCDGGYCDLETQTCRYCTPVCDGAVWGENSCGEVCACDSGRSPLANGSCGVSCVTGADCAAIGCQTCMETDDGWFCTNSEMNGSTCGPLGGTCPAGFGCGGSWCTQLC